MTLAALETWVTIMPLIVEAIELSILSLTVIVWVPAVFKVIVKVWVPKPLGWNV